MSSLNREFGNVQNPALGAALLWRFASAYEENGRERLPAPLPLLFLVLPVILHLETCSVLKSTQLGSGIKAFTRKFADSRSPRSDLLHAIHSRALEMREQSLSSLRLAISGRLLSVDFSGGSVFSLSQTPPKSGVPPSVRMLLAQAEKLGAWCSEVSLHEVSLHLKVKF